MRIVKTKDYLIKSYTLVETMTVLFLSTAFFIFPIVSFRSLEKEQATQHFFAQFEKRVDLTQQSAIIHQQTTRFRYDPTSHCFLFDVPLYSSMNWQVLSVPDSVKIERHAPITYAPNTGNESSLKAYEFYLPDKKQRIIYQFQLGGGRYIKKIQTG